MTICGICKHAILDYEEYYGTTDKEWFVQGCELGQEEADDCEDYEEWTEGEG